MGTHRTWLVALFLVLVASPEVRAQGIARSFEQLRLLVRTGDTVTVSESSGEQATGRIDGLSASGLTLLISGKRREFREADVNVILQRWRDPLANGAMWGFIIGAGVGVVGSATCDDCGSGIAMVALAGAVYGAIGVGIGVGVDALITGRRVIYQRPAGPTAIRLVPLLGSRGRGVALSLRF